MNRLRCRFEAAIADGFVMIGADTTGFITRADGEPRFIYGGMPPDWRANLVIALKVLYHLDEDDPEPWGLVARGYELRETILTVVNAMRYSEGALNRAFRQAIKPFATPERQARWRAEDAVMLQQAGEQRL